MKPGTAVSPAEAARRVRAIGYKTKSKSFGQSVAVRLANHKGFKRQGRGQYLRVGGATAPAAKPGPKPKAAQGGRKSGRKPGRKPGRPAGAKPGRKPGRKPATKPAATAPAPATTT